MRGESTRVFGMEMIDSLVQTVIAFRADWVILFHKAVLAGLACLLACLPSVV